MKIQKKQRQYNNGNHINLTTTGHSLAMTVKTQLSTKNYGHVQN